MKKLVIIPVIGVLLGCTTQKPTPVAPSINITYSDYSQTITGDNNKSDSRNDAKTETQAVATATAQAENTTKNGMWIFWTLLVAAAGGFAWFMSKKYKLL